jgi:hypothetical protein
MRGKSAAITLTIKPDFAAPAGRVAADSSRDKIDVNAAQTIVRRARAPQAAFGTLTRQSRRKR